MVRPFNQLENHRKHVLRWFKYSLRNIKSNVDSAFLKNELSDILISTLRLHKNHKSSWFVRGLLNDLARLNELIYNDDHVKLNTLRDKYKRTKVPIVKVETKSAKTKSNSGMKGEVKEEDILSSYLYHNYKDHQLTRRFPAEYGRSLIMPLAKHEYYTRILHSLEKNLTKGPPVTHLNYTIAGQSRIWFVRSAVNKKQHQSKALGRIVRSVRCAFQRNLDLYRECERNVSWAIHETKWEHLLEHGTVLEETEQSILRKLRSSDTTFDPPINYDWIAPINDSLNLLLQSNNKMKLKYINSRKTLIENKTFQHFDQLSQRVYQNKLKRYLALKAELPNTNPFTEENNLGSLLIKWKFLHPNKVIQKK